MQARKKTQVKSPRKVLPTPPLPSSLYLVHAENRETSIDGILLFLYLQEKKYKPGDWLVFGAETTGLSPEALEDCGNEQKYGGGKVRIPMVDTYVRSLNLAVSVGIGVYEALRQLNVLENMSSQKSDVQDVDSFPPEIGDAHNLEV
jgi:tRNA(Leu) C34 or U34 (ribose-2'-O)-methylase TrmL